MQNRGGATESMANANLNITVIDRRMFNAREAAEYCGLPVKRFPALCAVAPVAMPDGKRLYDRRDLDHWIDGLKTDHADDDDSIVARLK